MSSFEQLRQGLNRTWDQITEGWRQLRERTADAITHFNPIHRQESSTETHDSVIERSGARWGVLAADVLDDNDNVIVKLEIPGLDAENFDIQVVEKYLVVRGEKRAQRESREGRYHVLECAYGSFERIIPLPAAVDESRTNAQYRNGVLRVTLPKLPAHRAKRIDVKVR